MKRFSPPHREERADGNTAVRFVVAVAWAAWELRSIWRREENLAIADELVEDEFTAPASIEEQFHYGWSVVACLPAVMDHPDTAATGAVLRPATLRRYAEEAGFRNLETLDVDAELLRFYRLTP